MIIDNIKHILDLEGALSDKGLAQSSIKLYQMNANLKNLSLLPEDYVKIIEHANGIYYNGVQLYGLNPSLGIIKDLCAANASQNILNQLILGENESDWLVFDKIENEFVVKDKIDSSIWKHSQSLAEILPYFFNI